MVQFDRQTWFVQEIIVHEAQLRRYLRGILKVRSDVADGIQETYARLLSLSDSSLLAIRQPHAFLFAAARNVALEWLRREKMIFRELMAESGATSVLNEQPSADEQVCLRQELDLLARAIAALPERCREVLTLRKLHGLSQKQIAVRLRISENTVEKHVANGVRLCADFFHAFEAGAGAEALQRTRRSCPPAIRRRSARYRGELLDREARRAQSDRQAACRVRAMAIVEPAK